jgi:hypothetical protein
MDFGLEQGEVHRGLRSVVAFSQQNARLGLAHAELSVFCNASSTMLPSANGIDGASARFQGKKNPRYRARV